MSVDFKDNIRPLDFYSASQAGIDMVPWLDPKYPSFAKLTGRIIPASIALSDNRGITHEVLPDGNLIKGSHVLNHPPGAVFCTRHGFFQPDNINFDPRQHLLDKSLSARQGPHRDGDVVLMPQENIFLTAYIVHVSPGSERGLAPSRSLPSIDSVPISPPFPMPDIDMQRFHLAIENLRIDASLLGIPEINIDEDDLLERYAEVWNHASGRKPGSRYLGNPAFVHVRLQNISGLLNGAPVYIPIVETDWMRTPDGRSRDFGNSYICR